LKLFYFVFVYFNFKILNRKDIKQTKPKSQRNILMTLLSIKLAQTFTFNSRRPCGRRIYIYSIRIPRGPQMRWTIEPGGIP
jgi:hypothetical protein